MTLPCNVLNKDEVQRVLYATRPDYTIYCVGVSSLSDCAQKKELAEALNTNGLFNVAEYCQRYKSQICYISSNYVFSGERKKYLEMDIPDANTVYGKTQASAEFYIQKTLLNYLVFRCGRLYGRSINPLRSTWFDSLQKQVASHETVKYDDHVQLGFLDVYYLGLLMKICFDREVSNRLFQVSSTDVMTYYEFAQTYLDVFGEAKGFVSKSKWRFPFIKGSVAPDQMTFEMEITNMEGFARLKLPSIKESLEMTYRRLHGQKKNSNKKQKGEGVSFI